MKQLRRRGTCVAISLALTALATGPAGAQEQTEAGQARQEQQDEQSADSVTLDTMVVTAERRATSLMSTGLSASVLSQEDLAERSITNLDSLPLAVPALTVSNYGGGNLVNIRGVGRSEVVTQASAGVPIYRDGVPTFNAYFASAEPYFDIWDVQVLRGPQGTFAGQNSTGGAIFVRSADPSLTGVGGHVQLGVGDYSDVQGQFVLNLPLSDTFAIRLASDAQQRDGFYEYSGDYSGHPEKYDRAAGRLGLLWRPNDRFEWVSKVDYNHFDYGANHYAPIGSPAPLFEIASDTNLFAVDRFTRWSNTLSYTFGNGMVLRSSTGHQSGKTRQKSDSDGTNLPIATLEYHASEKITSQEFNLISPDASPLRYVVGAFYSDSKVGLPMFDIEAPPVVIGISSDLRRKNSAVFGNISYDIAPGWQLEAGARYNHATVDQDLRTTMTYMGFPLGVTPGPSTLPDDDTVTGRLGVSWQVTPAHFLYGFVATGHKNSGLNTSVLSPPSFDGEDVTDIEFGYKGSFLDNRLRFQASYYHYDYKNYQFNQYDVDTRSAVILNVPGKSTSQGVELQLDGYMGATAFNLAASYATSKLPTYFAVDPRNPPALDAPACAAGGPSSSPQCLDLSGRRLPFQPRTTFSAGLQHRFEIGEASLTPRLDVAYTGSQFTNVYQIPGIDTLESRTIFNGNLTWASGPWTATLYSTNLSNEQYVIAKLSGLRVAGAPRQYGLRVMRTF